MAPEVLATTVGRAVREERGQIYSAPEVLAKTNRYNENDDVSKRVHEPAFGIVICVGRGAKLVTAASGPGLDSSIRRTAALHRRRHMSTDLHWGRVVMLSPASVGTFAENRADQ